MKNEKFEARTNIVMEKSFDFAIRITNLYKYLTKNKKEFVLSKQLLRSGTSIGANISEAQMGQSKPDFVAKMSIALKKANETEYWIRLLYKTEYLNEKEYLSIHRDSQELVGVLVSICKSAKK